jgi:hypothetical protein
VVLEENFRSQQALHDVARAVNTQQAEVVDRLTRFVLSAQGENNAAQGSNSFAALDKQAGCWLLDQGQGDIQTWRRVLDQWSEHHYLTSQTGGDSYRDLIGHCEFAGLDEIAPEQKTALDRLFARLAHARVLTLVREGPWGCAGINAYLEQVLRPRLDRHRFGKVFAGLPVLITRNDYSRLLFNGDVGIALGSRGGGYRVAFQRLGGYVSFPADALPAHEPAFAMTVHKSQGSEYDQVMLVLPPEGGRRLLTKEMIYTGITRARQVAVICSKHEVLRAAIARRVDRESALLAFGDGD